MKKKIPEILSLWLLFLVSLVIFIGISFSDSFKIGSYEPNKGSFRDQLTAREESAAIEDYETKDSLSVMDVTSVEIEPDTTVHSLLIFGDSMTHNLGMSIAKYGTKNNYKVTSVTWESSSIPGWSSSDKIEQYIEESKPDFIMVCLGSNETILKNFDSRIPHILKIKEKFGDIPFIWVGPPLWKEDQGLYDVIIKTLGKDIVFKTEGIDIPRAGDHIHPTMRGGDIWADTLMRWISHSKHPILTEKPDSNTSIKGHRIIYLHLNE